MTTVQFTDQDIDKVWNAYPTWHHIKQRYFWGHDNHALNNAVSAMNDARLRLVKDYKDFDTLLDNLSQKNSILYLCLLGQDILNTQESRIQSLDIDPETVQDSNSQNVVHQANCLIENMPYVQLLESIAPLSPEQQSMVNKLEGAAKHLLFGLNRIYAPDYQGPEWFIDSHVWLMPSLDYGFEKGVWVPNTRSEPIMTHVDYLENVIMPLIKNAADHAHPTKKAEGEHIIDVIGWTERQGDQ
ncbi:MAG: hypothetical protein KKG59_07465, partial [Nanoarchaeota archaeon]|nr:hypothetical protein [Nanoarchaeota archaeon]